jgi:hypothetical protein
VFPRASLGIFFFWGESFAPECHFILLIGSENDTAKFLGISTVYLQGIIQDCAR